MKITLPKAKHYFSRQLIRRAGYGEIVNREGVVSYVRILGIGGYPRFHAYLEEATNQFTISLHLDQKKPVYTGQTAHNGEYDGDTVEREASRILATLQPLLT